MGTREAGEHSDDVHQAFVRGLLEVWLLVSLIIYKNTDAALHSLREIHNNVRETVTQPLKDAVNRIVSFREIFVHSALSCNSSSP